MTSQFASSHALILAFAASLPLPSNTVANEPPTTQNPHAVIQLDRSPHAIMQPVGLSSVRWGDGFWAQRHAVNRDVSLRKLWGLLADPDAGHVLDNMRIAAGLIEGERAGTDWQDAWLYKWIEAAACLQHDRPAHTDPWIAQRMNEAIDLIAQAQEPDGYIATQITATGKTRFQDPREHEVYTMGHLLTAGAVHRRMTGSDKLFKIAIKAADFLCQVLGQTVEPHFAHNPSAVMGLVELYRETGNRKYLDCAKQIVDKRGYKPRRNGLFTNTPGIGGTDLIQDRTPLRKSYQVVGHNVFFTYLFAGASDVYLENGDPTLRDPLQRLWRDLVQRKMSINGGVSPMGKGISNNQPVTEAVGPPYYLPNADSYNETCGQIGNFMWNYRMLCADPDAAYADIMELELYNGFLAGVGLDGDTWFYRNSLKLNPGEHTGNPHNYATQRGHPGRKAICCPTNLLRTIAQLRGYVYSLGRPGLWIHHYG
ncbi:MAG: glycoside hydrolase family 127 protein, partial [Planctomycetota bacterium]